MNTAGTLFVVATPIGNLEDMTLRAIRVLKEVDFIAAEDTRHSRKLLQKYGISTPMVPFHQHNQTHQSGRLIKHLSRGESIALISDAGTPLISDPGQDIGHSMPGKWNPRCSDSRCQCAHLRPFCIWDSGGKTRYL